MQAIVSSDRKSVRSESCSQSKSLGGISVDRRADSRYPIALDLQYSARRRGGMALSGNGRTVDISRGGLCFTSDKILQKGMHVTLSIDWPLVLNSRCGLKLVVFGHVIRSTAGSTVVVIDRHEFRTRAMNSLRAQVA
jgi:PilZ domain